MPRQSGLGMVEVLVAVLVFAVGLLGVFGAQVNAKKHALEAQQRSMATQLARDLLERMRSNPGQLNAYALDNASPADTRSAESPDCAQTTAAPGGGFRCSPAELARSDLAQWMQLLAGASAVSVGAGYEQPVAGLLEPRACVGVAAGTVSVAIAWRGLQPLAVSAESSCGAGGGWYGPGDQLHRALVMHSWVGAQAAGVAW